ncbi:MAG TPA: four helix bundle protein [Methylomirabilota bacterium]|nr:four helix bundle protein [Methylomirabilota bacterium]
MKIESFEDIESWSKARELTNLIYRHSKRGEFARDFGLRDQIRRASTSIMSNIAEGFERGGDKEFLQFLSTAKGSCGEVRSQLYIALDQEYISRADFDQLRTMTISIGRLIAGFMKYLQTSPLRGSKYSQEPQRPARPARR